MGGGPKQRLLALDGLRAYAALAVIVYHAILLFDHGLIQRVLPKTFWDVDASDVWAKAWLSAFNGAAAVELFFLLSGCVLIRSLDAAKGRWPSVAASFAIKRALRIYPGLIPCVAVTAAVTPSALSWGDIAGNMALWNFDVVGPSWTLQVEMLAIPLLLIVSIPHRNWGAWGMLAVLVVAVIARKNQEMFVAPLLGQFGYLFILGTLVPSQVGRFTASLAKPVGWMPVVLAFVFLRQCLGGMDLVTAALGFVLLALLYHDDKAATAPVLVSRVPQFLGKVSFGIYLWNVPFFYMPYLLPKALWSLDTVTAGLIISAGIVPLSIFLATLSYRFIEVPGIMLGTRLTSLGAFGSRRLSAPEAAN
ncbi:acyltransferase [Mesorhizobium sp. B2-7-1]|uniref:acyltransferase family protein n=1 Tax=Mesorhizobium sp. B2-7-1 TaxID=2589909 RepID=UPI00112DAA25|nr:acyltransferase [Mesorhizobium sp. B2-7-1]TPJ56546.1 acyltransferase [Mesorhizobium sp. B2-7-1]